MFASCLSANPNSARTSRQLSDGVLRDELGEPLRLRMVPPHERLHQHAPGPLGGVERALRLLRPPRQRLLAEHVLAGLQRPDRPLDVQRVRQRDVDRVDLRVGEQRLVAAVRAREPVLGGVRTGALRVAAGDGDDLDRVRARRAREDLRR